VWPLKRGLVLAKNASICGQAAVFLPVHRPMVLEAVAH
jgi:hypothetical protein